MEACEGETLASSLLLSLIGLASTGFDNYTTVLGGRSSTMPRDEQQVRRILLFDRWRLEDSLIGVSIQILVANMPDVRPLASILRSLSFRAVRFTSFR